MFVWQLEGKIRGKERKVTFGGKVIELLEISIHDNLLLVSILERFASGNGAILTGGYRGASTQSGNISSEEVEEDGLGNIIGIVPSNDFVHFQERSTSVKGLSTEDAAESAIVFQTNHSHDLVHSPSVEVLVRYHFEREPVLNLVPVNSFQRVVAVAGDALVDGEEEEMEAVIVEAVELGEDVGKDGGILSARSADCDAFTRAEELILKNYLMDLRLKSIVEALPAYLL